MIKPPIVLSEPNDVMIFNSVKELIQSIEVIDVNDNVYVCYDSEGRLLKLSVDRTTKRPTIRVESAENEPGHVREVAQVLKNFLSALGIEQAWLANASLNDLILKGKEHQ